MIALPPEKLFIGKLYDFRKYDETTVFGVIYREVKSGKYYGKRSAIGGFILDKEYALCPPGCRLELLTPRADAIYLLSWYVRFLLGFLIMVNGSVILKKSNNKLMKSASYIMVYLIFVLEVLTIIPELDQQFGIEINLVFSWMFCNGTMWVIAMPVILIILTGTLLVVTQNEDIF